MSMSSNSSSFILARYQAVNPAVSKAAASKAPVSKAPVSKAKNTVSNKPKSHLDNILNDEDEDEEEEEEEE